MHFICEPQLTGAEDGELSLEFPTQMGTAVEASIDSTAQCSGCRVRESDRLSFKTPGPNQTCRSYLAVGKASMWPRYAGALSRCSTHEVAAVAVAAEGYNAHSFFSG